MKQTNLLKQIVIIMTLLISIGGISSVAVAKLSGSLSKKAVAARIKPEAKVHITNSSNADNTATEAASTQDNNIPKAVKIYKNNCAMCHAVGLAGAPKPGDKPKWDARLVQGKDILLQHVIMGYKAMPPKGGCMKCSKEDLLETIEQMITGEGLD